MRLSLVQMEEMARLIRVGLSVIELVDPADPETWRIAFNNPASSEASGTDVERFRGELFLKAFPVVRGTPFIEFYQRVHATQTEIELPEITYGDANVPEAAFRVWLAPLPGDAVLGQYVNVTAQRRAEGHLRQANAELEARVEQRTAELWQARRSLQELAHAAAHDLSTPVHHIQVLTDLLTKGQAADGASAGLLTKLRESAQRARVQLDALLAYTDHRPQTPPSWASADDLFSRARVRAETAEGAEVTWEVGVASLHTYVDQFEVIVGQLLDNALCFHRPGNAPRVTVRLVNDGEDALLTVADEGLGIPSDQHERIFTAFYRLHQDAEHPGIGLSLVRRAAEACGATITLESEPGRGSTFGVRFPKARRA